MKRIINGTNLDSQQFNQALQQATKLNVSHTQQISVPLLRFLCPV